MKKKRFADIIMVLIILMIVSTGVLVALRLTAEEETVYGSAFQITAIPDNRLVADENTENLCSISIQCDTILNNLDKLEEAKAP